MRLWFLQGTGLLGDTVDARSEAGNAYDLIPKDR